MQKLASVDGVKEDLWDLGFLQVSGKFYITLHAYVNPEMSVEEAHKIAEKIELRIRAEIKPLENITVHVEPASIAVPTASFDEVQLEKIVGEVTKGIGAYLRVKRIVTYAAEGNHYINIDCCFTKQIKIKEAHRISVLRLRRKLKSGLQMRLLRFILSLNAPEV